VAHSYQVVTKIKQPAFELQWPGSPPVPFTVTNKVYQCERF
jgi:hypothetical protein